MGLALGLGLSLAFRAGTGAPPTPPPMGALQVDTFPILVDTFEIIFA